MSSLSVPLEHARQSGVFEQLQQFELEALHFRSDPAHRLQAIIAIHSTSLGPALGGCRCIEYDNETQALTDAARLARGMSYKAALAGVPQGGGKSVILKPARIVDRRALYQAFGDFVDALGGRYITAIDSGTTLSDMDAVATRTAHVGGSHRDGLDPSPITALGVYSGLRAAVKARLGSDQVKGLRVALQGLGNVGYELAKLLHADGADLLVADIDPDKVARCVNEFSARPIDPEQISTVECEVFCPCGLGAVINDWSIDRLRCKVIAGSANNQLAEHYHGKLLHEQEILYAPDYVINAGGLINVSLGMHKMPAEQIKQKTRKIGDTLSDIFDRSAQSDTPTSEVADRLAEEILNKATKP
ncbi:MAG: amino acid dehydrogenase [Oleiphilus sp.]|nr:MAG: amino acid dehydrogenase [Oleiphilus sp.]